MRSMKEAGLKEAQALRRRVGRLRAMERIGEDDHEYIDTRLKAIEARIVQMRETDEYGQEVH